MPVSGSKTCVMPSFLPRMPFAIRRRSRGQEGVVRKADRWKGPETRLCAWSPSELDLDVDAGGQVEAHQLVDRLRRRAQDVDQPLVRAHLEVLARVLVLERAADHAVDVLLGRQGDRPSGRRAAPLRGVDDLLGRPVQLLMVVALQADPDFSLCHVSSILRYLMIFVTTPAPTVRPPSRIAKRRPSSMAIGWISSISMFVLSPGMTISWPSGSLIEPVTSVVRK